MTNETLGLPPLSADATCEYLGDNARVWISPRFKFGTDALLLARFALACAPHAKSAADLGTGCGVIPIVWTQQQPTLHVLAVELQAEGCLLAQHSAHSSNVHDRITVRQQDLRTVHPTQLPNARPLDLVACNPPYFRPNSGAKALGTERQLARAEDTCTAADAAQAAFRLLKHGGWFCMIHRAERLCDVFDAMRGARIEPKCLQPIITAPNRAPKLILVGGRRDGNIGLTWLPPVVWNENEKRFKIQ